MASREKVISDRAMRQWERLRLIDDTIEFVELKDITYLLRLSLTPDITAALTEGDPIKFKLWCFPPCKKRDEMELESLGGCTNPDNIYINKQCDLYETPDFSHFHHSSASSSSSAINFSTSNAAMHPLPALVIACRYRLSWTSPAANTPRTEV